MREEVLIKTSSQRRRPGEPLADPAAEALARLIAATAARTWLLRRSEQAQKKAAAGEAAAGEEERLNQNNATVSQPIEFIK